MRMLVSDMAGRASIELKGRELGYDLSDERDVITRVVERVKTLESGGYTFEAADASFELLLRDEVLGHRERFFTVESWRAIVEQRPDGTVVSEATVKIHVDGQRFVSTGEGNGPVNALDNALRGAITTVYPELAALELVDYKVRILDGGSGTASITRVLIETTDGKTEWDTIGVHENVIAASWSALEDAIAFALMRSGRKPV
jgi:2-isopropylmalate synthase